MAAAVVFEKWDDAESLAEHTARCGNIQPYESGGLFKRELPCLVAVLAKVQEPLDLITVDGCVTLGDKPGLGMRLRDALGIIKVAKTRFHSAAAVEIVRGQSKMPLFVTAVGIDPVEVASNIAKMAGEFPIPALLKRVAQLARGRQ